MRNKIGKILKTIGKNILAFFGGAVLGVASVVFFILPRGLEKIAAGKEPLAAIALVPVLLIIYGLLGVIIGGFGGIIAYNAIKLILRRSRH